MCCFDGCRRAFHVSCALKWGLFEEGPSDGGVRDDGMLFPVYCSVHGKKRDEQNVTC